MKVKCPLGLAFRFRDSERLDLTAFLQGCMEVRTVRELVAIVPPNGDAVGITSEELGVLAQASELQWRTVDRLAEGAGVAREQVSKLVSRGLLLSDAPGSGDEAAPAEREELGWHPQALTYHCVSRWRDQAAGTELVPGPGAIQDRPGAEQGFVEHCERHGAPPDGFYARDDAINAAMRLPRPRGVPCLEDLLARRQTIRYFDKTRSLDRQVLSDVLYAVWGCRGTADLAPGVQVQRKSSPSGGGLHPIECYPLIRDVEGIEPGLYHYRTRDHTLECLTRKPAEEVEAIAAQAVAAQRYFAQAHVVFVMAARFYRTAWKYREHAKIYRVYSLDAGHLSQTLYLTATSLGLGAFITAAINEVNIDEWLGLDGVEQGAIAVCGLGIPGEDDEPMTLRCEPYDPLAQR